MAEDKYLKDDSCGIRSNTSRRNPSQLNNLSQIANGAGAEFSLSKNCAIVSRNERLKYV